MKIRHNSTFSQWQLSSLCLVSNKVLSNRAHIYASESGWALECIIPLKTSYIYVLHSKLLHDHVLVQQLTNDFLCFTRQFTVLHMYPMSRTVEIRITIGCAWLKRNLYLICVSHCHCMLKINCPANFEPRRSAQFCVLLFNKMLLFLYYRWVI